MRATAGIPRLRQHAALALVAMLIFGGCAGATTSPSASRGPSRDPAADKLAQVQARGTLVLWTDPDYAPQSFAVKDATRLVQTTCAPNQMTAPEMSGYDAETGKLVAAALHVEPCFVATPFDAMIAGAWGDRFDVAWGSGAITLDRMTRLHATQPYYATPASFFVKTTAVFKAPADLSGRKIGVCSGCTHHQYLQQTLELPGQKIAFVVDKPEIVTFSTEVPGLEATAVGDLDAFLCSEPVGLAAIAKGADLRELEAAAYFTYKTGYVDRDLTLAAGPFLSALNTAISDLHAAGKLKALSISFFKKDYATPAAGFDLAGLGQKAP